jgi:hypothetical protein
MDLGDYGRQRQPTLGRINTLLAERFVHIARIDEAPWSVYEIYERRGRAANAAAGPPGVPSR